jgi:hypothetical protein
MSDFHQDSLTAIKTAIGLLSLTDLQTGELRIQRKEITRKGDKTIKPNRGITLFPIKKIVQNATNRSEDVGYGCVVLMALPADHAATEMSIVDEWDRLIRRRFINQRITVTAPSNGHHCLCTIEPGDYADEFDDHKFEISTLGIRVWTRETRT